MSHTKFIYSYLNSILEQGVQESFYAKQIRITPNDVKKYGKLKGNCEESAFDNQKFLLAGVCCLPLKKLKIERIQKIF